MSVAAQVIDGKIQDTSISASSLSTEKSKNNNSLDKDAFLQLLVAQMKYQDPLEPTSNTEYISQLATFSELEEMQNTRASMDLQRASQLIDKQVIMKVTNKNTGITSEVQGKVDYVVMENQKAYLAINEELYSLDDLEYIIEEDYNVALNKGTEFAMRLANLPTIGNLSLSNMDEVLALRDLYNSMDDYQKTFVAKDLKTMLDKYIDKMKEIMLVEGIEYTENVQKTEAEIMEELLGKLDSLLEHVDDIAGSIGGTGGSDDATGGTDGSDDATGGTEGSDDATGGTEGSDGATDGTGGSDSSTDGTGGSDSTQA